MANMTAIRNALAAQIETNTVPYLAAVGKPAGQVNVPCAIVLPSKSRPVVYGQTMDGASNFNLDVMILISDASTYARVQDNLDQWLGFENDTSVVSVPYAVEMDPTLGGVVDWCEPVQISHYGTIDYGSLTYFGATINFTIGAEL